MIPSSDEQVCQKVKCSVLFILDTGPYRKTICSTFGSESHDYDVLLSHDYDVLLSHDCDVLLSHDYDVLLSHDYDVLLSSPSDYLFGPRRMRLPLLMLKINLIIISAN